ncbi:uncharacterized protein LOC136076847 [Hydra vulgaris]|uniref:uncharacterized protein LOC136076847 n=1 Tax=Hydra vulgaris TaxID=6087 RepID=UPI0001926D5C
MSYKISFDVKPNSFSKNFCSVLHFTIGNDLGNYGDRTPAIWFQQHERNSKGFRIAAALNGNPNKLIHLDELPLNVWTNVVISQQLVGTKYVFTIDLNQINVFSEINKKPKKFEKVKVFASDPWSAAHDGSIKNLVLENGQPGEILAEALLTNPNVNIFNEVKLKKNNLVGVLRALRRTFVLEFELKLTSFSGGYRNIILLTQEIENVQFGGRVLRFGIIQQKLFVDFPTAGNKSLYSDFKPLPLDQWIDVSIKQTASRGHYHFSVSINSGTVYELDNLNANTFTNIYVYAGDLRSNAQDGSIKRLNIFNNLETEKSLKKDVIRKKMFDVKF